MLDDGCYHVDWDDQCRWICPICDRHNPPGYLLSQVEPRTMKNIGFNPFPDKRTGGDRVELTCPRCQVVLYTERYLDGCIWTVTSSPKAIFSRLEMLFDA